MKNLYCELENFGIIKDFKHRFRDGITVLSGENGQGKSTVLKALDMNLFDRYSGNLEDYLNWDAEPETTFFRHKFSFEHRGHSFVSTMKYDGKSSSTSRELYVDGATTPYKNSEAVKKLAEFLDPKMDPPAMIARQGTVSAVDAGPAERREHMRKAFDVNFPEEIKELQALESQVEKKIVETDKKLVELQALKFEPVEVPELPLTVEQITELSQQERSLRDQVSTIESAASRYSTKLAEVHRKTKSLQLVQTGHDSLVLEITQKEQAVQSHPGVETLPAMISLVDQVRIKSEYLVIKESDKTNLESEITRLRGESSAIVLDRTPAFDRGPLDEALSLLADFTSKLTRVQSDLDSLNRGECPTCNQPLTAPDKIASLETLKREYTDTISDWTEKRDVQNRALTEHLRINEEQSKLRDKRSQLDQQVSQKQENVARVSTEISNLKTEISQLNSQKDKLVTDHGWVLTNLKTRLTELQAQRPLKDQELITAREEYRIVCQELAQIENPELKQVELTRLKTELETVLNSLREQDRVQAQRVLLLKQNEQLELDKIKNIEEQQKYQFERQTLGSELLDLTAARMAYQKDLPTFIVLKKVENISLEINEFLRKTYKGRYSIKIVNRKDSLLMLYGPRDKDVKLASGYEKQVFSMAYQIALNKMQDLDLVILDEVDSEASESSSLLFYRVLGEIQDAVRQKIVVSHKPVTKDLLGMDFGADIITFENGVAS